MGIGRKKNQGKARFLRREWTQGLILSECKNLHAYTSQYMKTMIFLLSYVPVWRMHPPHRHTPM